MAHERSKHHLSGKIIDKSQLSKDDSGKISFNSSLMDFYRKYQNKSLPPDIPKELKIALYELEDDKKKTKFYIEQLNDPQYMFIEIAHKLGIALRLDTKGISSKGHEEDTDTLEGLATAGVGFHWLANLFNDYTDKLGTPHTPNEFTQKLCFLFLAKAFREAEEAKLGPDETANQFVKTGELFIVPSTIPQHNLGVALIGDRLIYTNTDTGSCGKNSGTFIYKLSDIRMITGDFLKKLSKAKSIDDFNDTIKSVVSLSDSDSIFIPSKRQKVGNCGLSSPKKNSKGILPCLQVFLEAKKAAKSSGPIILDTERINETIKAGTFKTPYKQCTCLMRDQAVDKLIDLSKRYQEEPSQFSNPERIKHRLIKTIATYLYKKENSSSKNSADLLRVERLSTQLKVMPPDIQEGVKSEIANLVKLKKEIETEKEKIIKEKEESIRSFSFGLEKKI